MKFKKYYLRGIKTPILLPENYKPLSIKDNHIEFINVKTGERSISELLFYHDKHLVFPRVFKTILPNDSTIIILVGPDNKLYLQRRGRAVKWAPMKIDLASVAGQRRAILVGDHFENEDPEDAALREISEETGIGVEKLNKSKLFLLGTHYNPQTNEYQTIYAYKMNLTIEELNRNLKKSSFNEVEEWIEKDSRQVIEEYFGRKVKEYAGGARMRPVNFISNLNIRRKLEEFIDSFTKG
jgi:8-oxo-dGTP pyrophosphatase MutT (NUDIX family)